MKKIEKVCWNITSECNKKCTYCFKFYEKSLCYEDNKKILDKLIKTGVKAINWSGGEPFLYKDFVKLLKESKERGIHNYVNTNGSLLNEENLNELLKYIDKIVFSLDFVDDNKNKINGIGENYYLHLSKILEIIKKIDNKILIQINTVVFSKNYNYIDNLFSELKKYDIDIWKITRFIPMRGKALVNKDELSINDNQFKKIIEKYKNEDCKFKIKFDDICDMVKTHYIVLSSGKFIESVDGKDNKISDLI